jgi:ATP-binding cassette subfamily B protein
MGAFPSAWLLAGLAALTPAFTSGHTPGAGALAISLGGVLLAQRAFSGIIAGIAGLSRAAISWRQVAEVAGPDAIPAPAPLFTAPVGAGGEAALISARGLSYRYDGDGPPVFQDLNFTIGHDDRVLLEGASGGGKSTLSALLCGLRTPTSGSLLMGGFDRHSLGSAWRTHATSAPQFHDNHILSGTLAFNLLMGRGWPATASDLREAEAVCRDLGLGDLLDRMPSGLHQPVGETGWQLSHGERSRVYLARALLQGADLTILDESFAALDPETLAICMEASVRRAGALVVVAHP